MGHSDKGTPTRVISGGHRQLLSPTRRPSTSSRNRIRVMLQLWSEACYAIKRFFHDKHITRAMFCLLAVDVLLVVSELLMDTQSECVVTDILCKELGYSPAHILTERIEAPKPHRSSSRHSGANKTGHHAHHDHVFGRHATTLPGHPLCEGSPIRVQTKLRLHKPLEVWHAPVHFLSLFICGFLLTECVLIMLAEGPSHWLHPLYAGDFCVLSFSIYCDVALSQGAEGPLLLFVRVWRFARIFHALFMLGFSVEGEVVQSQTKRVTDQFQQEREALQDQLRRVRNQNDRLIRELRALKLDMLEKAGTVDREALCLALTVPAPDPVPGFLSIHHSIRPESCPASDGHSPRSPLTPSSSLSGVSWGRHSPTRFSRRLSP